MATAEDAARDRLRGQVTAAAVAAQDDRHPGHWHLHHIALAAGPGDFTPYQAPDYAEEDLAPHEPLLEWLAELFGADHAQGVEHRGLSAGKEAGE